MNGLGGIVKPDESIGSNDRESPMTRMGPTTRKIRVSSMTWTGQWARWPERAKRARWPERVKRAIRFERARRAWKP